MMEVGEWKLEAGGWKLEVGSERRDARCDMGYKMREAK